jgi:hypothetical protein
MTVTDYVEMGIEIAATQALEVACDAVAGMEIVECAPFYDAVEMTSLKATRVICDVLACQVRPATSPSENNGEWDRNRVVSISNVFPPDRMRQTIRRPADDSAQTWEYSLQDIAAPAGSYH